MHLYRRLTIVRDMVNAPASDMMPQQIADAMSNISLKEFGLTISECVGNDLD